MPKYYYCNRPPGIGCQPDGFTERETWLPAKEIDNRLCFGYAVYPKPLAPEQVYRFDLRPESIVEQAEYVFWREDSDSDWLKENYLSQPVGRLRDYASRDVKAWAALVLKGEIE